ncbi:hypothetical protein LXL04_032924 [Taraxacum kok-saghyz]
MNCRASTVGDVKLKTMIRPNKRTDSKDIFLIRTNKTIKTTDRAFQKMACREYKPIEALGRRKRKSAIRDGLSTMWETNFIDIKFVRVASLSLAQRQRLAKRQQLFLCIYQFRICSFDS